MNDLNSQRPSPESLLEEAKREGRGKLKIFLGASPGVGKTYAMLSAAQAKRKEGIDVVIGYVETHRRAETDALMDGLESMPRLHIDYRGIAFDELDIDAVLSRKPKLALVDELAHTNIPGARHTKRYQDVMELLDAGIDVYTTLNVQHIESLNDIVTRITGIAVRETVPDSVMQRADSLELIDLPPDELLQRLKEGKVYIPEQARLAMNRFFTPGNLTALRELALRQAAERVDDQMTSYMRSHAITGPWPTSDRVLVCISDDGQAIPLIRTAKRSAERRRAPWIALYIETHRHTSLSEETKRNISQALHLAENLGGETMTIASEDVVGEILRIASEKNVSAIIIGKSNRHPISHLLRPSVSAALLREGDSFDITVMSLSSDPRHRKTKDPSAKKQPFAWLDYGRAALVMGISSVIGFGISKFSDTTTITFIYLIGVLLLAVDRGFRVSLAASIMGFLACDFFFIEPRFSLSIERWEDFLGLSFYLVIAITIGLIGDRLQKQVNVTQRNARRTQELYDFNRLLTSANSEDDIRSVVVQQVGQYLKSDVILMQPTDGRLDVVTKNPETAELDTTSSAAMHWAWHHGKTAGLNSDTLPNAAFLGIPLATANEKIGVIALRPQQDIGFNSDQEVFLTSLANQSAIALLRAKLTQDITQARLQSETERLRTTLLSSISHDLRFPLASILGEVMSLQDHWQALGDDVRLQILDTIQDHAQDMQKFVNNLLDMSSLVTGALSIRHEDIAIYSPINHVLQQLAKPLLAFKLAVNVSRDLPRISGDITLLERVFYNILDNSVSFSSPNTLISITGERDGDWLRLTFSDQGLGIPEQERERVFDMFYRIKAGNKNINGAGLGLAICRGYIEAHGGKIWAQVGENGKGTQIVIRLPIKTA